VQLALFEPDIPQNTGTLLRTAACLQVPLHIIEPAGFDISDRTLRRAGLDYIEHARLLRHGSFPIFEKWREAAGCRLLLLTTSADKSYTDFSFQAGDVLLMGRESAGVPAEVHAAADARLKIPIAENTRSLNVAIAAAFVLGEGLRQTGGWPV
jgi:tRNA (cytidine/uridine-2'-O-)-methyltransferase